MPQEPWGLPDISLSPSAQRAVLQSPREHPTRFRASRQKYRKTVCPHPVNQALSHSPSSIPPDKNSVHPVTLRWGGITHVPRSCRVWYMGWGCANTSPQPGSLGEATGCERKGGDQEGGGKLAKRPEKTFLAGEGKRDGEGYLVYSC